MAEGLSNRPDGGPAVLCARHPCRAAVPAVACGGELARRVRASRPLSLLRAAPVEPRCQNGQRCGLGVRSECGMHSDLSGSQRMFGGLGVGYKWDRGVLAAPSVSEYGRKWPQITQRGPGGGIAQSAYCHSDRSGSKGLA